MKIGVKKGRFCYLGDENFLNLTLARNDSLPMSEEETGDLSPGSGLVVQVHPYYCNTCQMTEMHCFTFERYFGSCKAPQPNFQPCCRVQKLCFQTNLKMHSLHLRFAVVLIWFVCTKAVFSLESIMALFTFWIL